MDPLRNKLPVVGALPFGMERMDEATAARYGLVPSQRAQAQGLVDRFGRAHTSLRISVTERCNLRCSYCMPEEGVPLHPKAEVLSFEEIERLAALFVRLGITRIRLTGGEPLVRKDFPQLALRLGALRAQGLARLQLTTNALLLEDQLPLLREAGFDGVNISLDTLRPERFRAITRRDGCAETIAAIRAAARVFQTVKVNAVALQGTNQDELCDLARLVAGELGLEMRYIEYMPFDGNHWSDSQLLPAAAIRAELEREFELLPLADDGTGSGTAALHGLRDRATGARLRGRVGIISSMTEPFCSSCSRLRLTADGMFRWCLLDEAELDLKAPLRAGASDAALMELIESGLSRKRAGHAPAEELLRAQSAGHARSMVRIGG
ncbi:MAG: GTP 3',8-cyclase MoaA [Deltaproteobacteria bacterium]|nr:GTP 3',8-cyclase MoaA [Deltaproteobacteria bacterium]